MIASLRHEIVCCRFGPIVTSNMPIMNGECPIDEEDVVTHDQVSDQASALSVDEASDGQGHVTVEQGRRMRMGLVRLLLVL